MDYHNPAGNNDVGQSSGANDCCYEQQTAAVGLPVICYQSCLYELAFWILRVFFFNNGLSFRFNACLCRHRSFFCLAGQVPAAAKYFLIPFLGCYGYQFVIKNLFAFFNLSGLTGPIFDKELRVSSRRRRNYVLRSIYIILLMLFVVLFWVEQVRCSGSALYRSSRMAEAGRSIVLIIVWFQFIASQLIAVVMLSSAISDEIYHKTLGVLMTTPINSFQIVFGKLFSKLLQLLLLLAVSFPLLAVVRVFGGIPWGYVVTSLCITLSTCYICWLGQPFLFDILQKGVCYCDCKYSDPFCMSLP